MSFDSLHLLPELLRSISEQGYSRPTTIQCQAIPAILQGSDIMGSAQTGTGKTAGFILPLMQLLVENKKQLKKGCFLRALILTPTRELAAQVAKSIETYGKYLSLKSTVIFGGVRIGSQIAKLRQGVDILVATPGRLLDHVNQKTVDLSKIDIFVLDEADRMLDMGFIHDIRKILNLLPEKSQRLLFSATFSNEIKKFAKKLLNSPIVIETAPQNDITTDIEQAVHYVDRERKTNLLLHLIDSENWQQVLVFTRTKHGADRLTKQLRKEGIKASAIHGNKSQNERMQALANFKKYKVQVLVATDIAARGLDINQLPHVVNFELPDAPEDYIHRIGRTGRAGHKGKATSLVCINERKKLQNIEYLIKQKLPKIAILGYEPDPSIKAEPILKKRTKNNKFSFKKSSSSKKFQKNKPNRGRFGKSFHKKGKKKSLITRNK